MLPRQRIPRLRDLIAWPPNFDHVPPHRHAHIHTKHVLVLRSPLLLLPRRSPGKIGLMFPTLCVSEIGAIVLMYCKAEAAFEGTDMILEKVGVFIEIDGF